jgi:BolA protein
LNASAARSVDRVERIRAALASLAPSALDIVDDSPLHAGHAGARSGHGHFRLRLVSPRFAGLAPLARQRAVYAALGALMHTDIHALNLETLTPEEAREHSSGSP